MVSNDASGGYFDGPGHEPPAGPPPPGSGWAPPGYGMPPPGYGMPPPGYGAPPGYPPSGYPPAAGGWQHGGAGWGAPQAPKPGIIPLRPLSIGELLDGGFSIIRRYPAATLGLAGAVMLVVETLQVLTTYYTLRGASQVSTSFTSSGATVTTDGSRYLTVDIVVFVVGLFATVLLSGMLTAVVGPGVLGQRITPAEAWRKARGAFWRLFGTAVLIFLISGGTVLACILPGILLVFASGGLGNLGVVLLLIGALTGGCLAIHLAYALSFATPIVMLENQRPREALRRSRVLVRGSWWRVFGVSLLAGIIGTAVSAAIEVPFGIAGGFGGLFSGNPANSLTFTAVLLNGIGSLLAATLVRPFSAGIRALLYIDQRMRREALDLSLQQAAATPAP